MIKRLLILLLSFIPALVFADTSTLSFSPPSSDYSMVFLSNLFGVVDGVLHGTGSQIMGAIFIVFNSAVLALGGIVIMYTLIVSTMNTAHEGQMLGQKWSSIWIPLRSTFGLALLIPKASGYCLMQIFVMWVVTQGVGAADKVWGAALGYLNRGGVIVQAQQNPGNLLLASISPAANAVPQGAMTILVGQVCMLGLQKQLEAQRTLDMQPSGACNVPSGQSVPASIAALCNNPVPDLLSSINFVAVQQNTGATGPYTMPMPNIASVNANSPYTALDGLCGTVKWNAITGITGTPTTGETTTQGTNTSTQTTLTASQLQTAQLSRAIAIQQMFIDLATVSLQMVSNDPQLTTSSNSSPSETTSYYSLVANQQFGVPYTIAAAICTVYNQTCDDWGPYTSTSGTNNGVLFNGTEFYGAIQDYNAIMSPTINLQNQIASSQTGTNSKSFINQANEQGWIMAGAYFYNLVQLNGSSLASTSTLDTTSGLNTSVLVNIAAWNQNTTLMGWLNNNQQLTMQVESLIDGTQLTAVNGSPVTQTPVPVPVLTSNPNRALVSSLQSSTAYGYINNALMMQIAGQPGIQPLQFANVINFNTNNATTNYLQPQNFSCGHVRTFTFNFCLGQLIGNVLYNSIILTIYNVFILLFQQILEQIVMAFIMIPIQGMSGIFQQGVQTIDQPGANPVVALANMGINYINFSGNLWITLLGLTVTMSLFAPFFMFVLAIGLPIVISWLTVMVTVGFVTAYYVPILPYMIFTFGAMAWLIAVIEAMVAAPIVALGVTHPEGHDAFGKGEAGVMLLMNVFLRPALMIIGYISGIALSYVSVWMLNAGYDTAINFMQPSSSGSMNASNAGEPYTQMQAPSISRSSSWGEQTGTTIGFGDWASIFAWFFSILIYTTMYLTVVQKSFTLISYLPDKVLRWIGGTPESLGSESAQWGDENVKGKLSDAGDKSRDTLAQLDKSLGAKASEKTSSAKKQGSQSTSSGDAEASASMPGK